MVCRWCGISNGCKCACEDCAGPRADRLYLHTWQPGVPIRSSDSLCTCSLPIYRQWSLKDSLRILALLQYVHDTELSVSHRAMVLWWWAGTSTAALATLR